MAVHVRSGSGGFAHLFGAAIVMGALLLYHYTGTSLITGDPSDGGTLMATDGGTLDGECKKKEIKLFIGSIGCGKSAATGHVSGISFLSARKK